MSSVFHTGNWEIKFMAYISILGNSEMIEEKVILTTISNSTQKMLLEIIWGKYVNWNWSFIMYNIYVLN